MPGRYAWPRAAARPGRCGPLEWRLPAHMAFRPHAPAGRAAIFDEVIRAADADVMSLESGVRTLRPGPVLLVAAAL